MMPNLVFFFLATFLFLIGGAVGITVGMYLEYKLELMTRFLAHMQHRSWFLAAVRVTSPNIYEVWKGKESAPRKPLT
jgi:ABC-type lipoprotein release transport system permease subunit